MASAPLSLDALIAAMVRHGAPASAYAAVAEVALRPAGMETRFAGPGQDDREEVSGVAGLDVVSWYDTADAFPGAASADTRDAGRCGEDAHPEAMHPPGQRYHDAPGPGEGEASLVELGQVAAADDTMREKGSFLHAGAGEDKLDGVSAVFGSAGSKPNMVGECDGGQVFKGDVLQDIGLQAKGSVEDPAWCTQFVGHESFEDDGVVGSEGGGDMVEVKLADVGCAVSEGGESEHEVKLEAGEGTGSIKRVSAVFGPASAKPNKVGVNVGGQVFTGSVLRGLAVQDEDFTEDPARCTQFVGCDKAVAKPGQRKAGLSRGQKKKAKIREGRGARTGPVAALACLEDHWAAGNVPRDTYEMKREFLGS